MLLTLLLLLALAFREPQLECRIVGDFFAMAGDVEFQRIDHCVGIDIETKNGLMLLHSDRFWVAIPTPMNGGHMAFHYLWGSSSASFAGEVFQVAYGRTRIG